MVLSQSYCAVNAYSNLATAMLPFSPNYAAAYTAGPYSLERLSPTQFPTAQMNHPAYASVFPAGTGHPGPQGGPSGAVMAQGIFAPVRSEPYCMGWSTIGSGTSAYDTASLSMHLTPIPNSGPMHSPHDTMPSHVGPVSAASSPGTSVIKIEASSPHHVPYSAPPNVTYGFPWTPNAFQNYLNQPTASTLPQAYHHQWAIKSRTGSSLPNNVQDQLAVCGKTRTREKYRMVYTDYQRLELEKEYHYSKYITIQRKTEVSQILGLSERQIKIWFQNRRAKERKMTKRQMSGGSDGQPESGYQGQAGTTSNQSATALVTSSALDDTSGDLPDSSEEITSIGAELVAACEPF